jgi:hypothetical protein
LAALCFRLLPDGTFHGDSAGSGPVPWPRTVAELPSEVLDLWDAYAGRVRSPGLRARLHDLLAAAGTSGRHTHSRGAISAYREAATGFLVSAEELRGQLRAVESLARALDIAVRMNQRDLRELVTQDMIGVADSLLGEQAVPAGLVYQLLERLQSHRLEVDAVRSRTERACAACPDNIHLLVAFLRLLRSSYADPVTQKDIDRRIVTAMIASAEASPPMLRLLTLNDAAVQARNAGLNELFSDLARKIQGTQRADLGLVPAARIPVQLTPAELDAALAEVDQAADLADALWRIAGPSPPAGSTAVAEQAARALSSGAPLASSIHRGSINPAGPVPVSLAGTDGQASVAALFQVLSLERAGLAVEAQLDRVRERFAPGEAALTAVVACKALGSESRTRMLVHAGGFQPEISSFRLHLAAEGKAARTVRTYTEAVQWFAAAYLRREGNRTCWEGVRKRDVQEWVAWLLGRYSAAYASNQYGRCSSSSGGWLARRRSRTRWPGWSRPASPISPSRSHRRRTLAAGTGVRGPGLPGAPRRGDGRGARGDRDPAVGAGRYPV